MKIFDKLVFGRNDFSFEKVLQKYWHKSTVNVYERTDIQLMNYDDVNRQHHAQNIQLDSCTEALYLSNNSDYRVIDEEAVVNMRQQLSKAGFTLIKAENITTNVRASIDLDTQRVEIIERQVPIVFRWLASCFAAVKGTPMQEGLRTGELESLSNVLPE